MRLFRDALPFTTALLLACGSSQQPAEPPVAQPGGGDQAADDAPARAELTPPKLRLPDHVTPLAYRVDLSIDPSHETFNGAVEIDVELTKAVDHVWMHGTDLTITSAELATGTSHPMTEAKDDDPQFLGFTLPAEIGPGKATIRIEYTGVVSEKDYSGLFHQQDDERWYLYSQMEAFSARRVFPSFDEPRWKVPFTVSLTVPEEMQAFSNTPEKETTAGPADGTKKVLFQTTKPLPTYLVAVAAGPFEIVEVGTAGRNDTPVRIIVPKGKTDRIAFAKSSTVELQRRLEDYFDMAYPYAKIDHIALPHFLGAMENPGLVTYDMGILLSPETESRNFKRRHSNVVAHEIAHQWFGNLVTLAWWDDIWLNESFATWLAAKVVDDWKPEWKGITGAVAMRNGVMAEDSMITARKVRQPIEDHSDIAGAFDGITYGKGSAVLWMFEQAIGAEKFREGVRNYIRANQWKTATSNEFLAAIGEVSEPGVPEAFASFLDQPGLPMVTAGLSCEKGEKPAVTLSQKRYLPTGAKGSSDQTWKIPVCLEYDAGRKAGRTCTTLTEPEQTVELGGAKRCPRWLLGNADAAGYYRVAYEGDLLGKLLARGGKAISTAERVNVIGDLNALVNSGEIGAGDALAQLPRLLKHKDPFVVQSALGIVSHLDDNLVPEKLRPNRARFIRKTFGAYARKLGWTPNEGEEDETRDLRSRLVPLVALKGEDQRLRKKARKLADRWLETGEGIDGDDVSMVLSTAAYDGDEAFYEKILARLEKAEDDNRLERQLIGALASFRDPALVKRNFQMFLENDDLDMRASFGLMAGGLAYPETREMVYQMVKDNHEAIMDKLPRMARGYVVMVARAFCDQEHHDDAKEFFGPLVKKELQGEKLMAQTLEGIQLCMAKVESQQPKVEAFLKKY